MAQVFLVEVEESGGDRRWARAEVAERCTLSELHAWIAGTFGLSSAASYGFTRAGRRPNELCTFEGPGGSPRLAAEAVELGQLALRAGRRMIHQSVETPMRERIVRILEIKSGDLGATRLRAGEQGKKGRDPLARVDPVELLGCVRELSRRYEEELEGSGRPTAEELVDRLAVAREVAAFAAEDPMRILAFEGLIGELALEWMADLHRELQHSGQAELALEALEAAEVVLGASTVRGERLCLLAKSGRVEEAREDAGRWLEEAREDPWALVHVGDFHQELGESERARELWTRAAELGETCISARVAALERLQSQAEEAGRRAQAAELGRLLAQAQAASEREERDADLDDLGPAPGPRPRRNDPCPCGSGKKFKRCCGSAQARVERTDAEIVDELLSEIDREGDAPEVQAALRESIARFAGEEFARCRADAVLPFLPADGLDEALLQWKVLDLDVGGGRTAADLAERRLSKQLDRRESALFEQLKTSAPCVWRVDRVVRRGPPVFVRAIDLLDPAADPVEVELSHDPEVGEIMVARLLAVDGVVTPGAGTVTLESGLAEEFVPRVRRAFVALRSADPDTPWERFRKRHACDLYRELIATVHDDLAKI